MRATLLYIGVVLTLMLVHCGTANGDDGLNTDNIAVLLPRPSIHTKNVGKSIPWQRQLPNASLEGWPTEQHDFLLVQTTTLMLYAFHKEDGGMMWWLPLDCVLRVGGSVSKKSEILALACEKSIFAVKAKVDGKFHHKKDRLKNTKIWEHPAPGNTTFVAFPLIRNHMSTIAATSDGTITSHDLKDGRFLFQADRQLCPVPAGTPLPLHVAKIAPRPLVACVVNDSKPVIAMINGETGKVEGFFTGPQQHPRTPQPKARTTTDDQFVVKDVLLQGATVIKESMKAAEEEEEEWRPIITSALPFLELDTPEDPEDGEVGITKGTPTRMVWAMQSTTPKGGPSRTLLAGLQLTEDRRGKTWKLEPHIEYHILPEAAGQLAILRSTSTGFKQNVGDNLFITVLRCGSTCLRTVAFDVTNMADAKVVMELPGQYVSPAGGASAPVGVPQQIVFDSNSLLVQQKVTSTNTSFPRALLSAFHFDAKLNTSVLDFTNPMDVDFPESIALNANIAAVPESNGVGFLNATSGKPQWPLPLVRTPVAPSSILTDANFFFFGAGSYVYGIPRYF